MRQICSFILGLVILAGCSRSVDVRQDPRQSLFGAFGRQHNYLRYPFFKKNGGVKLQSEALYYGGRVCRDMGDAPQSLDFFRQALETIEGKSCFDQLKGKISSQMG